MSICWEIRVSIYRTVAHLICVLMKRAIDLILMQLLGVWTECGKGPNRIQSFMKLFLHCSLMSCARCDGLVTQPENIQCYF